MIQKLHMSYVLLCCVTPGIIQDLCQGGIAFNGVVNLGYDGGLRAQLRLLDSNSNDIEPMY